MQGSRILTGCAFLLAFANLMTAEPIRYSVDDQYAALAAAEVILLGSIDSIDTRNVKTRSGGAGLAGAAVDVRVKIRVHQVFRGELPERRVTWTYRLQFDLKPSLRTGDTGLFFFNLVPGDGDEEWQPASAYLAEDGFASLPAGELTACGGKLDSADVLLSLVDAAGAPLYTATASGAKPAPDLVATLLAGKVAAARANVVCLFTPGAGTPAVLAGPVALNPRWPYRLD